MRDHLEPFRTHLAERHAPRTVTTYLRIATAFVTFVEHTTTATVSCDDVTRFVRRLRAGGDRPAVATMNQELAALRVFFAFLRAKGLLPDDPTRDIPFLREPPREATVLTLGETRRLFEVAATTTSSRTRARDLAVLALLAQAGLRVHEVVGLDMDQVDLGSATLLAVRGKGGSVHNVPMNVPVVVLLTAWLAVRGGIALASEPALFVSRTGARLGVRAVQLLLVRLREAMSTKKKITPHTLRHTTATLALSLGADLSTVADLLRHADVNVTRRYLHLVDERRREAVQRLAAAVPPALLTTPPIPPEAADIDRPTPNLDLDVQRALDDPRLRDQEHPLCPVPVRRAPHRRLAQAWDRDGRCAPAPALCEALFGVCAGLGLTCLVSREGMRPRS